ncbi:MAG: V-type ATP synthase subunit E [Vulcanimicrobiota bacterium]
MSLAELKAKIMMDADAQVESIKDGAASEEKSILEGAKNEIADLQSQLEKEAARLAEERYQNIVTLAKVDSRNDILAMKRKLVKEVFDKAKQKMNTLSDDKLKEFARSLLMSNPPEGNTSLVVGRKMKNIVDQKFLDSVNKEIKTGGKFVLSDEERPFDFGFYFVTRWIDIDLTIDGILRSITDEMETKVIEVLFGKAK